MERLPIELAQYVLAVCGLLFASSAGFALGDEEMKAFYALGVLSIVCAFSAVFLGDAK